jgi:hypothetical protein
MKLFKMVQHIEGDKYLDNILLSIGKSYYFNMEPDGWYIRIEMPFTKVTEYVDATDYSKKIGPCKRVYLIRSRPGIERLLKVAVWKPVSIT